MAGQVFDAKVQSIVRDEHRIRQVTSVTGRAARAGFLGCPHPWW
jgi:hypothetical protein